MLIFIKRNIHQELKISTYETCTLRPQSTLTKMKTLKTQHFAELLFDHNERNVF